jgi:hypothetical protein
MATLEGVRALTNADTATEEEESPGILRSFARGAIQSPANMQGTAEFMLGRPFASSPDLPGEEGLSEPEKLRGLLLQRSGIPEPTTFSGRVAEGVGQRAPLLAAGGAVGFAVGGLPGLALEIGRDVVSSTAGETARELGAGPMTQLGVEIIAAALMPKTIVRDGIKPSAAARPRAHRDARLKEIAKKYDVSVRKVRQAERAVVERLEVDPTTKRPKIEEALDLLRKSKTEFPDPSRTTTTTQALGEDAGQNFTALDKAISRSSPEVSSRIQGVRGAVKTDLIDEITGMAPTGRSGGISESAGRVIEFADAAEVRAWNAVPFDDLPITTSRPLKAAYRALAENPAERQFIPRAGRAIRDLSDEVNARDLQTIASDLKQTIRSARKPGAHPDAIQIARRAKRLLDPVQREIDSMPDPPGGLYSLARKTTKAKHALLQEDSKAYKALTEFDDPEKQVKTLLGARRNIKETRLAREILEHDKEGLSNLRASFYVHLFGDNLDELNPKRALNLLNKGNTRDVYVEVFGRDQVKHMEKVLKRFKQGITTNSGTPAAAHTTGSNLVEETIFRSTEAAVSPVQNAKAVVARKLGRFLQSNINENALVRELVVRKDPAIDLLELPRPQDINKWMAAWNSTIEAARRSANALAGRAGAAVPVAAGGALPIGTSVDAPAPRGAR